MTSRNDLESILEQLIAPSASDMVDGDLMLHAGHGGSKGNVYELRIRLPEGGERKIGPAGYAGEFEHYLRGVKVGLEIANGRHAADD